MDQMVPIVYFCREKIMSINSDDVTNDLLMLIREKRDIIIDMRNTVYISSAALRCFLIAKYAHIITGSVKIIKIKAPKISNTRLKKYLYTS